MNSIHHVVCRDALLIQRYQNISGIQLRSFGRRTGHHAADPHLIVLGSLPFHAEVYGRLNGMEVHLKPGIVQRWVVVQLTLAPNYFVKE